ncbi:MAG TPA: HDOD domain-containing protein [Rhodocyclaceae bacterium]|nr:HDOD domain-containing protein [Rhodocyclaceae bacterium]HRQ45755.1 HDOD domain-containing protein [Rhodocyclaceae bacterium]
MATSPPAVRSFLTEVARELSSGELSFPTLIDATLKIRTALNQPGINAESLARIVATEPLLAARVLRLANSTALNPGGTPVVDLRNAVVRVGFGPIRTLAIALAMEQLVRSKSMGDYDAVARALWDRCVDVAAQSFVIARRLTRIDPHQAMFAGVVHNIGAFYLLARLAGRTDVVAGDDLMQLIESWQVGIGHAVLSAMALPDDIVTAIAEQDAPFAGDTPTNLAQVLFIAIRLSQGKASKAGTTEQTPALEQAARVVAESDQERTSVTSALTG